VTGRPRQIRAAMERPVAPAPPRVASLSWEQTPKSGTSDPGKADAEELLEDNGARSSEVTVEITQPTTTEHSGLTPRAMVVGSSSQKALRPQMSRLSYASRISADLVSEAMTEVLQGIEPLGAYCTRLVRYHSRLLVGSIVLVAIGVAGGMAIEGWSFLTSLYVIVQISTTIGYGDVTVDREWMQLFMTVYVLLSLLVVANFLNVLLNAVIERQRTAMLESLVKLQVAVHSKIHNKRDARRRLGKFNKWLSQASCLSLRSSWAWSSSGLSNVARALTVCRGSVGATTRATRCVLAQEATSTRLSRPSTWPSLLSRQSDSATTLRSPRPAVFSASSG